MALLTAVILGRLVLLQGLDGTAYAAAASAERLREDVVAATRGQILDANGNPLAYTISARKIYADPSLVTDPEAAATTLSGICLLYTSPSPRDRTRSRMPSSA